MEIKIHKLSFCTKIDIEKCISETDAKNKGHIALRNKRMSTEGIVKKYCRSAGW